MSLYEKLDVYQQKAVSKAVRIKSCCIYFEQGVGKSHPTVSLIEEVATDRDFTGFLICLLTNLETTWIRLFEKHLKINWTTDWEEFKKMDTPKLFLKNYEGLPKIERQFTKYKWTFGGFDESQRLKARGNKASRIAAKIRDCHYRVILSGTPDDGDPIHLFGQLRFVAPQLFGNDRGAWKRFDAEFLKPTGYMGHKRKFRPDKLPEFLELVSPYIIRVEADDVLELPKSHLVLWPSEMLGRQKRTYRKMEKDLVVKLIEDAKIKSEKTGRKVKASAGLKITQMVKLQQICGGYITDDDGELHSLGSCKLRDLHYILTRKAKLPIVIFHKYSPEGERIGKLVHELGFTYGFINGKVKDTKKDKARTKIQDKFQSGKLDVLICQVKSGGVGLDLYKARTGICYSTTFSWIDFDQIRKRIRRRGQENISHFYFIYVENSIDADIYSRVVSKKSVSKSIFNQMKRRSLRNG